MRMTSRRSIRRSGHSDWREIVQKIKAFGSQGKKTAVISTVSGDANGHLYNELAAQAVDASKIPVMALSVSERELRGVDPGRLTGQMAARNYFQSAGLAGERRIREDVG